MSGKKHNSDWWESAILLTMIATAILTFVFLASSAESAPPVAYQLNDGSYLVRDELFVSIVSKEHRVPVLCCYTVTAESQSGSGESRNFHTLIPEASLERADYVGSGYDIGHLAPLGSFDGCPEFSDVNCLENCAPQLPNLNRGPWLKLEERERELARQFGFVHVSCSVLFAELLPGLSGADEPHHVPTGFRKVIAWNDGRRWVEAYIFPQTCNRSDPLEMFRVHPVAESSVMGIPTNPTGTH